MKLNNNLYGLSGGIKCGKDLVGDMINYIAEVPNPSLEGFEDYMNGGKLSMSQPYEIKKFADKLKECVALIIGCTRKQLEDQEFKNTELGPEWWYYTTNDFHTTLHTLDEYEGLTENQKEYFNLVKLTPRLILQLLGTEGGRKIIHPNIWVNSTFADYTPISNWIITDLRFPKNEGKAITTRNGLTIGIKRLFRLRFPEYEDLIDSTMDGYAIPIDLKDEDPELYKNLNHESETAMGDLSWCDIVIENNDTIEKLFDKVLQTVLIK